MKLNLTKAMPKHPVEIILSLVLILYILGEVKPPRAISNLCSTPLGVFVLIASVGLVMKNGNTVITVLYLISMYELYRRCAKYHGKHKHGHSSDSVKHHPVFIRGTNHKLGPDRKNKNLSPMNQFPVTLEENVVKNMAPWVMKKSTTEPSYVPVMDSDLEGSSL